MVFSEQGDFFTHVPSNGKRGEREILMSKLENGGREWEIAERYNRHNRTRTRTGARKYGDI